MSSAAATSTTAHIDLLGGQRAYRRLRLAAARAFSDAHPNLDAWMATPLDARLGELHRHAFAWQLVSFALVTGRCRADAELLFAKNFGHSVARWVTGLFPTDVEPLRRAADRLGVSSAELAVREVVPLAVAFSGRPPSSLTLDEWPSQPEAATTPSPA
jgi:hypothetical protein